MPHPLRFESKKRANLCSLSLERLVRTNRNERTTSKRTPQFLVGFPKSDRTIYLPSGISEIFCQMVSTPVVI